MLYKNSYVRSTKPHVVWIFLDITRSNAPINVKPEGGGVGLGNPREFDRDAYPQGGDFDLTSRIWSVIFKE